MQEPIKVDVDVKPTNRFHMKLQQWGVLPKKRVFILHPITMGNLIRISKLLLTIDMSVYELQKNVLESNYHSIVQHGEPLARIIAIAISNRKAGPSNRLVSFILENFTAKEMQTLLAAIVKQMDLVSFMSSIISVKGMNILESKTASAEIAND